MFLPFLTSFDGHINLHIFPIIFVRMDRILECLNQNDDINECQPYLQSSYIPIGHTAYQLLESSKTTA